MNPLEMLENYLLREYPRPRVDLDWLRECYEYVLETKQLDPATSMEAIIQEVDFQFLSSSLRDSTKPDTGFPTNIHDLDGEFIPGPPVLVEITAMEEIGHSAFSLVNVAQARSEYTTREARRIAAGVGGVGQDDHDDDDDEPDIKQKYPRSMLSFQLSDGCRTLEAFEYTRLPEIELGETPIGFKMVITHTFVRGGRAFLEPANVMLKRGSSGTTHDAATHEAELMRSLKRRMGLPIDDGPTFQPNAPPGPTIPAENLPPRHSVPAPESARAGPAQQPAPAVRSPLREIPKPPDHASSSSKTHNDDEQQPRRRKVPARSPSPPISPPTHSRYFSDTGNSSLDKGKQKAGDLARELIFSPHRHSPLLMTDTDEELDTTKGEMSKMMQRKGKDPVETSRIQWSDADMHDNGDASSEYGFDEIPDEVMAELDRAEEQLVHAANSRQTQLPTQLQTTLVGSGRTAGTSTQATLVGSNHQSTQSRAQWRPQESLPMYIEIDDDDDDEKENIAAPTRHVRRRIQPDDDDVIELSD